MMFERYKEGLERLSIILFVTVVAAFILIRLLAGDAPTGDAADAEAIARELARECENPDKWQLFTFMCDDRVLAEFRLRHFFDKVGLVGSAVVALVAAGLGYYVYRWAREGFRED